MAPTAPGEPEPPRDDRWYQFGLGKLFLVTTLVAVLGAAWAGMAEVAGPATWRLPTLLVGVLLVLAAPTAVLILVSLFRSAIQWLRHRQ